MKKSIITVCLLASFAVVAYASGKKTAFVSSLVNGNFKEEFTNAQNVSWSMCDQYMKAEFTQNNLKQDAYYTTDGDLVASTHDINFSDLPAPAQKEIMKKYKNYSVKETLQYFDASPDDNVTLYGSDNNSTLYFVYLAKNNVELKKNNTDIILKVTESGDVSFFSTN